MIDSTKNHFKSEYYRPAYSAERIRVASSFGSAFCHQAKYTFEAAMESAVRPPLHEQASSVIGTIYQESEGMPECRAFCHWLGQQFADGEPDREDDGLATL